ncbi:hypothetical protein [Devosia ginsengisoli]|uniref:ATP-binding protein n=1 Tax=Devosia ginsengisoli TaxID=400770 RepID=A0A5B8LYV8_9HYPH|nr:hypothetical protein [Devosia ginsengisoli]QDZ12550.1 hypothetical protein FPZ08_18435 [Devosia ginsengisoli]
MTHLLKPDMAAVLERTHLSGSFDSFLLPVYEAGSNSIHSLIEHLGADHVATQGKLTFAFSKGSTPEQFSVAITDNAAGLNDTNFRAFRTPFTGNKLRRGGKGFGRFIAFKVFESIQYKSRYNEDGQDLTRAFVFDVSKDEEITELVLEPEFPYINGCAVTYESVRPTYHRQWEAVSEEKLLDHLTSNFLTYLVDGRMPETVVEVEGKHHNLRDHFAKTFKHEQTHLLAVEIEGVSHDLRCDVSRVERGKPFSKHTLLFFADNRLLGAGRAIENKIGRSAFQRPDGTEYVVIATLSGTFLDTHANQARTALEVDEDQIATIVDIACEAILQTESAQHELIKDDQRDTVVDLLQRHPLLRYGLSGSTVADYVKSKPNSWRQENFVSDLAVQRLREERRWTAYVQNTIADKDLFDQRKSQLLQRVSDTYRDALAEYIVHRKAVIEIADRLRGADDNGTMTREDAFHQLIFPRHQDSVSAKQFQHNLWMLDERLAFVSYISSDRTLHGGRRQLGDKVTDIAFYDECYVTGGQGNTSVVIVEFKRPGRDDYSFGKEGSDPIRRKSFLTTSGKTIDIPTATPITAIIVADLEPSLRSLAKRYDFDETWDKRGLYKYHEEFDVFVEVFGFDKLVSDAEKRNAAFFEILLNDLGN